MFWSGNFMAVRELNFLLKEENVTLASVLEADDILQECKADNKALIQFLTRPDILAELITLITEEPPKNVELTQQYRHASIACEVLTSHLSTLSDRLTLDTVQMNRLCDFINKDPPLNPLLASYFSKTVEMLLERSPKQDWYLYHIVCLRVLDFFKSRRDFLPNLLRHIATSAIADTFKYLIRLDDLFNKPIMEWLEEHQFIDSLIQIICGTYVPEHFPASDDLEKGQREPSEKERPHTLHNGPESVETGAESPPYSQSPPGEEPSAEQRALRAERMTGVAAANAAALLCDLVATGCAGEGCSTRSRTAWQLAARVGSCACVRAVLGLVFTCAPRHRAMALQHAAALLHALLHAHNGSGAEERCGVELAVAPHLPLLHQALLHERATYAQEEVGGACVQRGGDGARAGRGRGVGAARVTTAALVAQLANSEVEEVATTLITLGTPELLVALMFEFPDNNFLHAQVVAFCRLALANRTYRPQYARHLFVECDLLTRLMDAFEDNENKLSGAPRAGYMGHVVALLRVCRAALLEPSAAPSATLARWHAFCERRLDPVLHLHDTPLGGSYPSDNIYELNEELDNISDTLGANYDFSEMAGTAQLEELGDELPSDHEMCSAEECADIGSRPADQRVKAQSSFLELASQRFDDDMWDDGPAPEPAADVWAAPAWESEGAAGGAGAGGEGWAQFDAFAAAQDDFTPYWPPPGPESSSSLEARLAGLQLAGAASLASNLLTAMSAMSPAAIANIVNANLQPAQVPLPPESAEVSAPTPASPPAAFSSSPEHALPSDASLPLDPSPAEATPVAEAPLPAEASPPAEETLTTEATPLAEATPLVEATSLAEATPLSETTLPAEATLLAETKSLAEATSPAEANSPAEATSPADTSSSAKATLPVEATPTDVLVNESCHLRDETVEVERVTDVESPQTPQSSTVDSVSSTHGGDGAADGTADGTADESASPREVADTSER